MAKFNAESPGTKTRNYMGAKSYKDSPEFELVNAILTSFAADSYYEKAGKRFDRIEEVLEKVDPLFAAKAAIFARTEFGMRSITHVTAKMLASKISGEKWAKNFFKAIVYRPDDMTEIVSLFSKGKLPNALKKGFAEAFDKFDEYQLAKYRAGTKEVKLVDVVNLVHPMPIEKNKEALSKLIKGTLVSTETWESKLTQAGQLAGSEEEKAVFKKDAWSFLISSKKLGYFALLKNLRNIIQQAPGSLPGALEMLVDERLIKKSLVLPFRYLSAYTEVSKLTGKEVVFEKDAKLDKSGVIKAIEKAIEISIQNIPVMEGKTLILSDNSGSMTGDTAGGSLVSAMSSINTANIANLFAVMYWMKADNTMVGLFGDRLVKPTLDREKSLFQNFAIIDSEKNKCGGATERGIFDMFETLIKERAIVDTIVVFSDCQIGDGCQWYDHSGNRGGEFNKLFQEYKKINPNVTVFSVNLKGYGTDVFSRDVFKLSGWSEKIFDIMNTMKQDKNALINKINAVEF